jgi:hypothetical protein
LRFRDDLFKVGPNISLAVAEVQSRFAAEQLCELFSRFRSTRKLSPPDQIAEWVSSIVFHRGYGRVSDNVFDHANCSSRLEWIGSALLELGFEVGRLRLCVLGERERKRLIGLPQFNLQVIGILRTGRLF